MPRILELFCGTKSISKVFVAHGWEAVTLDFDPQFAPDICGDILTTEIGGEFDVIHASPLHVQLLAWPASEDIGSTGNHRQRRLSGTRYSLGLWKS